MNGINSRKGGGMDFVNIVFRINAHLIHHSGDISALYQSQRLVDPGPSSDDDLDDIIINRALQMNTGFTQMEVFTGILNRVSFRARFRVMCLQDYYGAHCNTHCVDRNDDVNGHYTCNRDGSFQCLEGFENPNNNCRDSKLIMQTL